MSRRKRSPEEQARREKIRELLQTSGISSMEDIQNLFKETIAEFIVVCNGMNNDYISKLTESLTAYKDVSLQFEYEDITERINLSIPFPVTGILMIKPKIVLASQSI